MEPFFMLYIKNPNFLIKQMCGFVTLTSICRKKWLLQACNTNIVSNEILFILPSVFDGLYVHG